MASTSTLSLTPTRGKQSLEDSLELKMETVNTWQRFAEITVQTNDLDPLYEVFYKLHPAKGDEWMGAMLVYFLLFYHVGDAVDFADTWEMSPRYWKVLEEVALSKAPRGTERRHFRGVKAAQAVHKLASFKLSPWKLLQEMWAPTYPEFYKKMSTKFAGTQFGPYFIWKLYDIFNVCLKQPIDMSPQDAWVYMPDEPRKVCGLLADKWGVTSRETFYIVDTYVRTLKHPFLDRNCESAETETVLCMLKGYFFTKSHVIGDDIIDKRDQLRDYPLLQMLLPRWSEKDDSEYIRGELK